MKHILINLPFDIKSLEPHISQETLEYHHGKHHAGYINNLNKLIEGTNFESLSLEEIILASDGGIFNNAAQVYNHNFYFNGMTNRSTVLSADLRTLIEKDFGSMDAFKKDFLQKAATLFGSGWVWLSLNTEGALHIEAFSNAGSPLLTENKPLMTCDVWEHAYYIDYRNARAAYLEKWWELVNWEFVSENLAKV